MRVLLIVLLLVWCVFPIGVLPGCSSSTAAASGNALVAAAQNELDTVDMSGWGGNNYAEGQKYREFRNGPCPFEAWCADFVYYCACQAGFDEKGILPDRGSAGSTDAWINFYKNSAPSGTSINDSSSYTPVAGDICARYGHIGIVKSYDAATDTMVTIEGNSPDKVTEHTNYHKGTYPYYIHFDENGSFSGGGLASCSATGTGDLEGAEAEIAAALQQYGLSNVVIAAVLGNAYAESGYNSGATDGTGLGDSIGVWQFTNDEKYKYLNWCEAKGKTWSDYATQVEWMFSNGDGTSQGYWKNRWGTNLQQSGYYIGDCGVPESYRGKLTSAEDFENATDVDLATYAWMSCYEKPADWASHYASGSAGSPIRVDKAREVLQKLNSGGGAGGLTMCSTSTSTLDVSAAKAKLNLNDLTSEYDSSFAHGSKSVDETKYIVLHDTEESLDPVAQAKSWKNSNNGIAAHFIVGTDGSIVQCVSLDKIAHHAGFGNTGNNAKYGIDDTTRDDRKGTTSIGSSYADYGMNGYSIGIEMVHKGEGGGGYPDAQLEAVDNLIAYIDAWSGKQCTIICHKEWRTTNSDTSAAFSNYLANYKSKRTHA